MLREETNGIAREAVAASGRLHLSHVEPMAPPVHMNGTERRGLLEQQCDVLTAGGHLRDALNKAAPHGRDYYPLGDAALARAQGEHASRRYRLDDLLGEIEAIATAVQDQGRGRERAA